MSRVGPFAVGIVVAGIGYGALSQQLVYSRNRLMAKHFEADSAELYYPRRGPGDFKQLKDAIVEAAPSDAQSSANLPEHRLVTDARKKWNAAVMRGSDAVVGVVYGRRGDVDKSSERERDEDR